MKRFLIFLLVTQLVQAEGSTSATQQLELVITPAPLQLNISSQPPLSLENRPRTAESQFVLTRERVGNEEVVTLSAAPSGPPLARP